MPRVFSDVAVYEWESWNDFLIMKMLPGSVRIQAAPVDSARRILSLLPDGCRYFIFHVNSTFAGGFVRDRHELVAELSTRGIRVLNAPITDISKPWLQRACGAVGLPSTAATCDGPDDELIMIKTSRNSGGASDRRLSESQRSELGIHRESGLVAYLQSHFTEYPVLQRREIPTAWWRDEQLCLERFIHNTEDRIYRAWFLLDRLTVATATCRGNTKKFAQTIERQFEHVVVGIGCLDRPIDKLSPLIDGLIRLRDHVQLDYGAVDIVEDTNGTHYVVDLNSTPGAAAPFYGELIEHLQTAL